LLVGRGSALTVVVASNVCDHESTFTCSNPTGSIPRDVTIRVKPVPSGILGCRWKYKCYTAVTVTIHYTRIAQNALKTLPDVRTWDEIRKRT
jgi:hypothetical protein